MKKFLCAFLSLLVFTFFTPTASAVPNYIYTTTVEENYTASSPIGRFENYSNNGTGIPVSTPIPVQSAYNYSYNEPIIASVPSTTYSMPVYNGGVYYDTTNYNTNYNTTYSVQDIEVPQTYTKTTTTTQQSIDTREKADKVIDRGLKVIAGLSIIGAVAGLLVKAF